MSQVVFVIQQKFFETPASIPGPIQLHFRRLHQASSGIGETVATVPSHLEHLTGGGWTIFQKRLAEPPRRVIDQCHSLKRRSLTVPETLSLLAHDVYPWVVFLLSLDSTKIITH